MLTITGKIAHEGISIAGGEIILNGPPASLEGHVLLQSKHSEPLRIKHLALAGDDDNQGQLRFNCRLEPGEQKMEHISHTLSYDTPPGTYERYLTIGGRKRKVKMIVQPNIEINLNPTFFTFQNTAPGTTHTAVLTLTNLGNLPFQVPDIRHAATLDMDYLCRAFGFAFRKSGKEGLMPTLDEIARNINENLADWANISVEEYGKNLLPGKSLTLHLRLTMPANSNARNDYSGTIRFWDKDLSFIIKSHVENPKIK